MTMATVQRCVIIMAIVGIGIVHGMLLSSKPQCFKCDYNKIQFTNCLNQTAQQCPDHASCHVAYDQKRNLLWTSIGCDAHCHYSTTHNNPEKCPYGGDNHNGKCHICCRDQRCMDSIIQRLAGIAQVQSGQVANKTGKVFCPGTCNIQDLDSCLKNGLYCHRDEYCYLTAKFGAHVNGYCESTNIQPACERSKAHNQCLQNSEGLLQMPVNTAQFTDRCIIDCCNDNNCIHNHFRNFHQPGHNPSTAITGTNSPASTPTTLPASSTALPSTATQSTSASPTSAPLTSAPSSSVPPTSAPTWTPVPPSSSLSTSMTQPMTSTQPSGTLDLFEELKTNCRDHLVAGTCPTLMQQKNACQDPITLELCADTCGICQQIRQANCSDTVLNNGCQDLKVSQNVCQSPMARYTCPETCGICDALIRDILSKYQSAQLG